jgi:hypothetical protein
VKLHLAKVAPLIDDDKMEDLYHSSIAHRCRKSAPVTFLFTTDTGDIVEVKAEDLPVTSSYSPNYDPTAMPSSPKDELPAEVVHYLSSKKMQVESLEKIEELSLEGPSFTDGAGDPKANKTSLIAEDKAGEQLEQILSPQFSVVSQTASPASAGASSSDVVDPTTSVPLTMVYNKYGELVSAHSVLHPPHSSQMSVLQCLRILNNGFHHNVSSMHFLLNHSNQLNY